MRIQHSGRRKAPSGKSVTLNSRPFTVIGVAPPSFGGISNTGGIDAWLTGATWSYLNHVKASRDDIFYEFVVRLARERTGAEVESELTMLARPLAERTRLRTTDRLA